MVFIPKKELKRRILKNVLKTLTIEESEVIACLHEDLIDLSTYEEVSRELAVDMQAIREKLSALE